MILNLHVHLRHVLAEVAAAGRCRHLTSEQRTRGAPLHRVQGHQRQLLVRQRRADYRCLHLQHQGACILQLTTTLHNVIHVATCETSDVQCTLLFIFCCNVSLYQMLCRVW